MKSLFLAVFCFALFSPYAQAAHVLVNCGQPGYWDDSIPDRGHEYNYYVWLMSDDTVQLQLDGQEWAQLGAVKGPKGAAISDLVLAELAAGDVFEGPRFRMKLTEEFTRPRQNKKRRFFRASFSVESVRPTELECVFGLK